MELLHSRVILGYKWHDNCDPNLSSTEIMHLCEDQTPSAGDHNLVNVNQKQLHLTFDRFWHYRIISHYYLTVLLHLIHSTLIVHSLQTKLTNHERTGTCWAHLARLSSLSECILVIQMEVGQWRERRASQFGKTWMHTLKICTFNVFAFCFVIYASSNIHLYNLVRLTQKALEDPQPRAPKLHRHLLRHLRKNTLSLHFSRRNFQQSNVKRCKTLNFPFRHAKCLSDSFNLKIEKSSLTPGRYRTPLACTGSEQRTQNKYNIFNFRVGNCDVHAYCAATAPILASDFVRSSDWSLRSHSSQYVNTTLNDALGNGIRYVPLSGWLTRAAPHWTKVSQNNNNHIILAYSTRQLLRPCYSISIIVHWLTSNIKGSHHQTESKKM